MNDKKEIVAKILPLLDGLSTSDVSLILTMLDDELDKNTFIHLQQEKPS